MQKEYRTQEQFEEIFETIQNGNWTQGAKDCVEYGFYANDLINAFEDTFAYESNDERYEGMKDLCLLAEMAQKERG